MGSRSAQEGARIRVLLVEDDLDDALSARRGLSPQSGFNVTHVRTSAEAIQAATRDEFDIYLLDYRLPDSSGITLCRRLRDQGLKGSILLVSSVRDDAAVRRAFEAGADDYIVKAPGYGDRLAQELRARREATG